MRYRETAWNPQDTYCSSTEFKACLRSYKDKAKAGLVHVMDRGRGGYVLVSVDLYERLLAREQRRAVWEVDVVEALLYGGADAAANRFAQSPITIEYLGSTPKQGDPRITERFENDLILWQNGSSFSYEEAALLREGLGMLADNPYAGQRIALEYEQFPHRDTLPPSLDEAYHMGLGSQDIVYGIDSDNVALLFGLIDTFCEDALV